MRFSVVLPLAIATALSLAAQTKPASPKPRPAQPAVQSAPGTSKPVAPAPESTTSESTANAAPAAGDQKVVMTVGDEKITAKEFDTLIEALPEQYRAQARGPAKRQMAEQIARVKLLAAEARKKGLDKDPGVQSRIQFQSENLLAGAAYNDFLEKVSIDQPTLQKYYDEHKNEFETVEARHILVKFKGSPVPTREGKPELTEEQALAKAQDLKKKLQEGAEFADLAKAESDDAGSGANGGDLGTFSHGQMVPAFEEAAFKLPVGQVSDPIKTQFGYHLIRVDKHETKTLDAMKEDLEKKLRPEAAKESVEKLRQAANISLDESYFGPATPPAAPPAPAGAASPAPAPAVK